MGAQPQLIDVAEREVVLADFVPFSSHVTDQVIRTREGDYLRVWKIAGIAFEGQPWFEATKNISHSTKRSSLTSSTTDPERSMASRRAIGSRSRPPPDR